jgi:hypothetical protein
MANTDTVLKPGDKVQVTIIYTAVVNLDISDYLDESGDTEITVGELEWDIRDNQVIDDIRYEWDIEDECLEAEFKDIVTDK